MKYCYLALLFLHSTLLFAQNQAEIDSLTQVLRTNISEINKVDTYNTLIYAYRGGDSQKASDYFERSRNLAREIKYAQGEAEACFQIAGVFFFKGNFKKALNYYHESLEISLNDANINGQANALNGLGNTARGLGEYSKAIDYFTLAIELLTEIGKKEK